jgi:hypothetical protein
MTTYLTIVTTILVLTQVIRVIQNTISIKRYEKINQYNDRIREIWEHMDKYIASKEVKE